MADEVATTGYARIIRRGLEIVGVKEDGTETLIYTGTNAGNVLDAADYFAWINGVTFETEPVEAE